MKTPLLVLSLIVGAPALAAPGDLDTSFNGYGYAILPAAEAQAEALCIDSSQRIVIGASSSAGADLFRGALIRFSSNGSWDSAFGWRQIGVTDESPQFPSVLCMSSYAATTIERVFLPDGSFMHKVRLDIVPQSGANSTSTLLGSNGFGTSTPRVALVSPYANRWIVGGRVFMNGTVNVALQTYEGSVPQFVGQSLGVSGIGEFTDAFIDGSGNLFAVGRYSSSTQGTQGVDAFVSSFNSAGAPRASFGVGGTAPWVSALDDYGQRIAPSALGGRLYVGITEVSTFGSTIRVLRLNANGTVDASFGGPYGVTIANGSLGDIVEDGVGRLIIVGTRDDLAMIRRLSAQGTPDVSFGQGGERVFGFGSTGGRFGAVGIDSQGRILAAGRRAASVRGGTPISQAVVVARLLP